MALHMADSVKVADLPAGFSCYAGYCDGDFRTFPQLKVRFPKADLLSIAVFAVNDADCLDIENGDAAPAQAPAWVRRQHTRGEPRPCLYANAATMPDVVAALQAARIARTQVRLWSAHYGLGQHICGPASCAYPGCPPTDGTQWTDLAPGAHGSRIDASVLHDNFFGGTVSATGPEHWDNADWQALRVHQLWNLTRALSGNGGGLPPDGAAAVDGAHKAFLALVPGAAEVAKAVVAALPPAQAGGVTQEQIEQAVQAGLTTILAKAVSGA